MTRARAAAAGLSAGCPSCVRFRPSAVARFAKKCRRCLAPLSPKRHRNRRCPRITCRRFARFASDSAHGGVRARAFSKIFFTADSALSGYLGEAVAVLRARCSAVCRDVAMQLMMSQNPLWNRGFKHFEKLCTMLRARCAGERLRLRAVDRARTTGSVQRGAYTLR